METVIKEELDLFQPELIIKEEKDEMSLDSSGYFSTGSPPDQIDKEMTPEELFSGCENTKSFQCQACDMKFATGRALKHHKTVKHTSAQFKCKECQSPFYTSKYLRNHLKKAHFDVWEKEYNGKRFSAEKLSEMNTEMNSENTFDKDMADLNNYWPCQTCSKIFPSLPTLTKHAEIHNKVEGMLQMLQKSFDVGQSKSNQTPSQKTKIFKKPVSNKIEVKQEPSMPKGFNCQHCGKTFENIVTLNKHAEIHNKAEGILKMLQQNAKQLSSATSSQRIKEQPGTVANNYFQCSQCDKTFAKPTYLKIHVTMKHKNADSSGQIKSDPQYKIKTELEEINSPIHENSVIKTREVPNAMFQQIKSNPQDKPFNCSMCDKTFADRKYLKIHFTVNHTTDSQKDTSEVTNSDPLNKPYPCSLCDKSYTDPSNLRRHNRNTHTSEEPRSLPEQNISEPQNKPFSCPSCDKFFADHSRLQRHVTMKHNSGSKSLLQVQTLPDQVQAGHLKSALKKEKPFSCSQCKKSFANQSHLKSHINMKHGEPEVPTFSHGIFGDIVTMDILGV